MVFCHYYYHLFCIKLSNYYIFYFLNILKDNGVEVVYLEEDLQNQINEASKKVWDAFYCRAYMRVDFILSNNKFYVLEINTLPGMTPTSLIPRSANAKGLSYSQLIDKIMETSLK